MALLRKMEPGGKTPTLYTHYGKQYNFDNFQKEADYKLSNYLSTLRRGKKDEQEFRNAYQDIMSGIKAGEIIFKDGKYIDSTGKRTNSAGNKNKDYYGLIANYIYNIQENQPEYNNPISTNYKWDGVNSAGKWLSRELFGPESNLDYFIELDPYNEETGIRGIDKRSAAVISAMKKLYNGLYINNSIQFDNLSDADKASYKVILEDAIKNAEQNGIGKDDYLSFSKAFGDLEYDKLFLTNAQINKKEVPVKQEDPKDQFAKWAMKHYPIPTRNLNTFRTVSPKEVNAVIKQAVDNLTEDNINSYLVNLLYNKNFNFNDLLYKSTGKNYNISNSDALYYILNSLQSRNLLKQSDSGYFYKLPSSRTVSLKWDGNNLQEVSDWDNPFQTQLMIDEYNSSLGNEYNPYFTIYDKLTRHKNGGILKAASGTPIWYQNLQDYDPSKYQHSYDMSRLVNADMSNDIWDPWVSNVKGFGVGRYQPSNGNNRNYTQNIENTQYYKDFGKALLDENGGFTDVGLAWAKAVDAQLPQGSKATFFDENGNLRTIWSPTTNDTYGRTKQTFTNLSDYINYVRNDQILGSRHNVFLNKGNRYFYKDQNGIEHWVDPNKLTGYIVSDKPIRSQWNEDKTIYWDDYELTGKAPQNLIEPKEEINYSTKNNKLSYIDLIKGKNKKDPSKFLATVGQVSYGVIPDIIGAGRLFDSLRTNNKVSETIRRALNPVLKDTYELYSPVTGAFSEMQLRNKQAANVKRVSSRPITSDASIALANILDANRQASDLEHQGFLADDKEILRTRQEALKRQEDNIARRSATANENRLSINKTNREKAELEATRLKSNWQSRDNFLQGIEGRLRSKFERDKERRNNFKLQTALSDINQQYQDVVRNANAVVEKWKAKNYGTPITEMPNYENYEKFIRDITNWKNAQTYKAHAGIYGYSYNNNYLNKSPQEIAKFYGYYKQGGQLKPNALYLINKIIKNENIT